MKENLTRVEFLINLNNNVVIQRFFNVRNFNKESIRSLELYDYFKDLSDELKERLKMKTLNYMTDNYYEIVDNPNLMETSNTEGEEYFNIFLKIDDKILHHRRFDAKVYPPKVRYTMDIRVRAKEVLKELSELLSSENFETEYLGINL